MGHDFYVILGTTYLAIAFTIQTIPPFIAGGVRYIVGAALLYAWLRLRSHEPLEGVSIVAAMLCGVLLSGIGNGFVIWAQQGVPSGVAALMVASMPVIVGLLDWAWFSRQRPSARAALGIAMGLLGVVLIVSHTQDLTSAARPLHLVALLAAVIGWSVGTLHQKRLARAETVLSFTCVQMFGGGLFQFGMATVDAEWVNLDLQGISLASVVALAYLIVFGSTVALSAYLWLLTRVAPQKAVTYAARESNRCIAARCRRARGAHHVGRDRRGRTRARRYRPGPVSEPQGERRPSRAPAECARS